MTRLQTWALDALALQHRFARDDLDLWRVLQRAFHDHFQRTLDEDPDLAAEMRQCLERNGLVWVLS